MFIHFNLLKYKIYAHAFSHYLFLPQLHANNVEVAVTKQRNFANDLLGKPYMLLKSHAQYLLQDIIQKARRKRLEEKQNKTKLGMMRHLYVILDMSEAMKAQDFKPTRLEILKI